MTDTLKLQLKRVIRADRSELFTAWTSPEIMKQWFAPDPMSVLTAFTDPRIGGAYSIEVDAGGEASISVSGIYTQIVPDELLAFTWMPCSVSAQPETLVTVTFRDVDGGTEISILHEGFIDTGVAEKHTRGWIGCLDKLARVKAAQSLVPVQ